MVKTVVVMPALWRAPKPLNHCHTDSNASCFSSLLLYQVFSSKQKFNVFKNSYHDSYDSSNSKHSCPLETRSQQSLALSGPSGKRIVSPPDVGVSTTPLTSLALMSALLD